MLTQYEKERLYTIARQISTVLSFAMDDLVYNTLSEMVTTIDNIIEKERN